jgi:hypothetical protein
LKGDGKKKKKGAAAFRGKGGMKGGSKGSKGGIQFKLSAGSKAAASDNSEKGHEGVGGAERGGNDGDGGDKGEGGTGGEGDAAADEKDGEGSTQNTVKRQRVD